MQVFVKRGIQGRIKDVVEDTTLGGQVNSAAVTGIFKAGQYEPYYTSSTKTNQQTNDSSEKLAEGGAVTKDINRTTSVQGTTTIGWGK